VDIESKIKNTVRDVVDFPVKGVVFKDITPILKDIALFKEIIDAFSYRYKNIKVDKIAGVESRGFLFGMPLAVKMGIPFIPVRKKGKLPSKTVWASYSMEYGSATIEMHEDAVSEGENVLLIDDFLATGGTVNASVELVEKLKGKVVSAVFVCELSFLKGRENIKNKNIDVFSIAKF
jgi:adenine phosphoribosyltransferase